MQLNVWKTLILTHPEIQIAEIKKTRQMATWRMTQMEFAQWKIKKKKLLPFFSKFDIWLCIVYPSVFNMSSHLCNFSWCLHNSPVPKKRVVQNKLAGMEHFYLQASRPEWTHERFLEWAGWKVDTNRVLLLPCEVPNEQYRINEQWGF